jgi:hypothetical protein
MRTILTKLPGKASRLDVSHGHSRWLDSFHYGQTAEGIDGWFKGDAPRKIP